MLLFMYIFFLLFSSSSSSPRHHERGTERREGDELEVRVEERRWWHVAYISVQEHCRWRPGTPCDGNKEKDGQFHSEPPSSSSFRAAAAPIIITTTTTTTTSFSSSLSFFTSGRRHHTPLFPYLIAYTYHFLRCCTFFQLRLQPLPLLSPPRRRRRRRRRRRPTTTTTMRDSSTTHRCVSTHPRAPSLP